MNDLTFNDWFVALTRHASLRQWQDELAGMTTCRDRLIRIPTGLGKTEGILAAWSFHRLHRADDRWPRRLVWCLPMRVLVEQTEQVAGKLTERIPAAQRPTVHVAMGGEDPGEWHLCPERAAIIIGTQDMLLSRALNRGYASARARWPMEFGLLNHDALWVMDEVQLMDVGLATSAQLQAFREEDRGKRLRPCHTWWMSATLQPEWLRTVDTAPHHENWIHDPCVVAPAQRSGSLWDIRKSLTTEALDVQDHVGFAQRILAEHADVPAGDFGRITLVVCNTVDRACRTFDALRAAGRTGGLELVHSRFRPAEREEWRPRFLSRSACTPEVDRIIVATQVVEAGVDLSGGCLITEMAPWPSLVQRFGRCARYGGSGKVLVVDRGRDEASATPYQPDELESAWEALQHLTEQGVGIAALEVHEESLNPEARARLYPFAPAHLLLRREFDELFDTTPDLTGADLDISRFIRSGDERDLQVFWIDLARDESPPAKRHPHRRELCAVPFLKARDWLCGEETKTNRKPKLRSGIRAWVWDWIDGEWTVANRASLFPGRVVCVAATCGGYRTQRGFDPESKEPVLIPRLAPIAPEAQALAETDDQQDGEQQNFTDWKTIACHTSEVVVEVRLIAEAVKLVRELQDILELAALFHDWGKSHPAFQNMLFRKRENVEHLRDRLWAKSQKPPPARAKYFAGADESDERCGYRHELASALGLFAILQTYAPQHLALLGPWSEVLAKLGKSPVSGEPLPAPSPLVQRLLACSPEGFDLVVYLVASHHGKVRVALHAAPKDQEYRDRDGRGLPIRGIREGDQLPSVALIPGEAAIPEVTLTLSPAAVGLSERTGISWRERCLGVMERYGPAGLAFLEAILRAADVRASRLKTNDPALVSEANA